MILPLLFQAQEVVQELLDAPKLKKGKKESHRFGYEDHAPRNVRPGETRNRSTAAAWSESLCMHSMLGFQPLFFLASAAARVHFLRPACFRVSHNETPPTVSPKAIGKTWASTNFLQVVWSDASWPAERIRQRPKCHRDLSDTQRGLLPNVRACQDAKVRQFLLALWNLLKEPATGFSSRRRNSKGSRRELVVGLGRPRSSSCAASAS